MFIKGGGKVAVIKDEEWSVFSGKHGYTCSISALAAPGENIIYFPEKGITDAEFIHEAVHILQHGVLYGLLRKGPESKEVKEILGAMSALGDDALRDELEQQKNAPIPYPTIGTIAEQFFAQIYEHLVSGNARLIKKLNTLPEVKKFLREYYLGVGLPIPNGLDISSPVRKSGSSPIEEAASSPPEEGVGGIDLRALPMGIASSPAGDLRRAPRDDGKLDSSVASLLQNDGRDEEWRQINALIQRGIIPSPERLKEYFQSCSRKDDIERVFACVADTLRLQEEHYQPTDACLKELLSSLEAA